MIAITESPPMLFVYVILIIAALLCGLLALVKRNWEHLQARAIILPLLAIGLSTNYQICAMTFYCR
jgi:hypothetical protein